ncbi:MAG: Hpt domain-containing protein [bacterium]|nr:Hpt domain-containing protein [bacterium]
MDDIDKIRNSFFIEAEEILENLEALLLDLEASPDDEEILNAVFRNIHTLKGSSGICELHALERTSHILEDLLDFIRSEKKSATIDIMDILFEGLDIVKAVFLSTLEGAVVDEAIYADLAEKIKKFLPEKEELPQEESIAKVTFINEEFVASLSSRTKERIEKSVDDGKRLYQISFALEPDCLSHGTDPLLLIKTLDYDGDLLDVSSNEDNIPALDQLDPVRLYLDNINLVFSTDLGIDEVNEIFEFARAAGEINVHQISPHELKDFFGIDFDDFWLEASPDREDEADGDSSQMEYSLDPAVFFTEARNLISEAELDLHKLLEGAKEKDVIDGIYRSFHTINGNAGMFGFSEIKSIAGFVEAIAGKIRDGETAIPMQTVEIIEEAVAEIKDFIDAREIGSFNDGDVEGETVKRLGDILVEMGELTADQLAHALEGQDRPLGEILVKEGLVGENKIEKALEKQRALSSSSHAAIRVDTAKLDSLVNMVGELVITQTMLNHNDSIKSLRDNNLGKIISQLDKITREVQDNVMSIRMLPVKATFQKLIRLARDISKKGGKSVNVRVEGEETELDKTVIDEIGDPLVHILRNAIDHGIEMPDERSGAGKDTTGTVELKAFHQGGNIVIEIRDDGKGLDKDAIIKKAIQKGLISDSKSVAEEDIFNLIFLPGFSTAKTVTDLSGRGVGMDVVKRNIQKLRGKVEIHSVMGKGSAFTIKLPLTLAVIDGMVVKVGDEKYILPTVSIVESLRPEKGQISTVQGRGEMVNVRGDIYPLIRLHELFDVEPVNYNPWEAMVMQVEGEGKTTCILVDELVGQQQVVIKSLGESFKKVRYVSGGAIMGDGRVGLILDTGGLISASTG